MSIFSKNSCTEDFEVRLTELDPIKRLEELCRDSSPFKYAFSWWSFKNGHFMTCKLLLQGTQVAESSHFFQDVDKETALSQIVAKLLYSTGLSPLESIAQESDNNELQEIDDMLRGALDELAPDDSYTESLPGTSSAVEESNPIIAELSRHLTPEQMHQNSGILSFVGSAFASLSDESAKNQTLGLLSMFAGMTQSSNAKALTEEINDIE
jgi:hypothetical protein